MTRAIIRFLILSVITFLDGLTIILFDEEEIYSTKFLVKPIVKSKSDEEKVLLNYLKKCHEIESYKGKDDKKRSKNSKKKQTDT